MHKFGDWILTNEWVESENARIPLDSISYVGSIDLMKKLRILILVAAIFFGLLTLSLIFSEFIQGAFISAVVCAVLLVLYNKKSTTIVIVSHSGFMIQQTSTQIVKGDDEYEKFMNQLFTHRRNFLNSNTNSANKENIDNDTNNKNTVTQSFTRDTLEKNNPTEKSPDKTNEIAVGFALLLIILVFIYSITNGFFGYFS